MMEMLRGLWRAVVGWLMNFEFEDPLAMRRAKTFIPLMASLSLGSSFMTIALVLAAPQTPFVEEQIMIVVCSSISALVAVLLARKGFLEVAGVVASCVSPIVFVLAIVSEPILLPALGWYFGIGSLLASYAMKPRGIFIAWFVGQVSLVVSFQLVGAPQFGVPELWMPTMGMLLLLITMASYLHARTSEAIFVQQLEGARQLEEAHAQADLARRLAVSASEAKSTFLAGMSHELRTPLNAIIGYSEMLIEDLEEDEMVVDDLGRIKGAGVHLLELINNILDLSKIEAGRMDLFIELIEVEALVDELVATLRTTVAKNHNEIIYHIDPSCTHVATDRTKFKQILLNLLSNASKFTSDGTITIEARMTRRDGRRALEVSVTDTGIGMTEEQLARVFDAFEQADNSTTRDYGGTGLGLALCLNLAELLEGGIEATSTPDVGSIFTFHLAAEHSEASAEISAQLYEPPLDDLEEDALAMSDAPNLPAFATTQGHLLVIDDDPHTHDLLSRTLTREGFELTSAMSGEEGLKVLESGAKVDAILLDILMPEENGWEVLRKLKRSSIAKEIPVVLMSVMDEQQRGLTLGASDYITKPFDRGSLLSSLGGLIPEREDHTPEILVVEDDRDTRDLLVRMLAAENWGVSVAPDGVAALESLARKTPDVILLDLMMPRMDGFEVLSELRASEAWSHIPVIIVTAKELSPSERAFLRRGAVHVMQKGALEQAHLVAHARQALGLRAA